MLFRSNFAFSKKAIDGFGKNESFQNTKEMVLGTNYRRIPKGGLKPKPCKKTSTGPDLLLYKISTNFGFSPHEFNKISTDHHISAILLEIILMITIIRHVFDCYYSTMHPAPFLYLPSLSHHRSLSKYVFFSRESQSFILYYRRSSN